MLESLSKKLPVPVSAPPVEIWGLFVRDGRFWRRVAAASLVWAFLALAAASWAWIRAGEPVAYHVDSDGQAQYVGALRASSGPGDVEARYVAKRFLKHHLSYNSLTITVDWAEAWNLMTTSLRKEHEQMLEKYKSDNRQDFVEFVRSQGIQTEIEYNDARISVMDHNGKSFTVQLRGVLKTWPLNRVGDDTALQTKEFESAVTLVTCPRTEMTPNGLLVAKVATRTFVAGSGVPAQEVP